MEAIKAIHSLKCPCSSHHVQLSLDGVQESKSGGVTTDTYSISFQGCRTTYPLRLIRPHNRYRYDEQSHIKAVLDDLLANGCIVDDVIADNPKRAIFRCAKNHASLYGCEYGSHSAVSISDPVVLSKEEKCIKDHIKVLTERPGTCLLYTSDAADE